MASGHNDLWQSLAQINFLWLRTVVASGHKDLWRSMAKNRLSMLYWSIEQSCSPSLLVVSVQSLWYLSKMLSCDTHIKASILTIFPLQILRFMLLNINCLSYIISRGLGSMKKKMDGIYDLDPGWPWWVIVDSFWSDLNLPRISLWAPVMVDTSIPYIK